MMQGSLTLYLSVVTGYLIVAYTVGRQLSTLQVVVISTLFLVFSSGFLVGAQTSMAELIRLSDEIRDLGRVGFAKNVNPKSKAFLLVVDIGGILAALVFMIHTRKSKRT